VIDGDDNRIINCSFLGNRSVSVFGFRCSAFMPSFPILAHWTFFSRMYVTE
jgi:hypothetical protein